MIAVAILALGVHLLLATQWHSLRARRVSHALLGLRGLSRALPFCLALVGRLAAQEQQKPGDLPRRLTPVETGCDSSQVASMDSIYEFDAVDRPVEARRLPIEDMPLRVQEVIKGRSVFRFVVEPSGRIDRCSIELVEETSRDWSDAVLEELRLAHYEPARKAGKPVRQRAYQVFTYHSDGRIQKRR